ncbi:hypothetical protein I4U23_004352 [Adineta vaga]|nr:hypothetical protein I4U23_004352 [Adineta vaga]
MDRFFISSRNALRRQWSSSKIAFRPIVINAIVWLLIYVQVLVFFDLLHHDGKWIDSNLFHDVLRITHY